MRRNAALWALAATCGLFMAAGISWATSSLTSQHIGLSSEPLSAGRRLAPPEAAQAEETDGKRTVTHPSSAGKAPTTTTPAAPPSATGSAPPPSGTSETVPAAKPSTTSGEGAGGGGSEPRGATEEGSEGSSGAGGGTSSSGAGRDD